MVGVVVSMPLLWKLADPQDRLRLREAAWKPETLGYLALAIFVLWAVFGYIMTSEFKHFYFLFLPLIWAASRQGVHGAALVVFVLQLAIVTLVRANSANNITVSELQMLDAVLALVGFFIGIVVDERRQVAEELKQTLRLASAGEMAAALAHELNQPMTALAVYGKACEHLLARGEAGELLKNAIGQMINESARAADVVRRLRDFFRTGAMQLEMVEAEALQAGIVQQFRPQFVEHGVQFSVAEAPALSAQVDRLQIELVLRNLLANALDAVRMQTGGERSIRLTAENVGGKLRFTVEDSGSGLTRDAAQRLFEPFVSTKASGMGLGLVLSRSIVEAHGGTLWAEVAAHGVFRFILPALDSGE
jgi:signal transduction histidine kinase